MIHDGSKAKHEPTGGTTAEEQLRPLHTAADATPRAGQAPQAQGQSDLHSHLDMIFTCGIFTGKLDPRVVQTVLCSLFFYP